MEDKEADPLPEAVYVTSAPDGAVVKPVENLQLLFDEELLLQPDII